MYPLIVGVSILLTGQTTPYPGEFRIDDWAPEMLSSLARSKYLDWFGVGQKIHGADVLMGATCRVIVDDPRSPLPKARSDGYATTYPGLHMDDLIPLVGRIYRVSGFRVEHGGPRPYSAIERVPPSDVPKGVHVNSDTYVFPFQESKLNGNYYSGTLHKHLIYVWELGADPARKDVLRAKVGTLSGIADVEKGNGGLGHENRIVWKWVHVGDFLDIGEYRHKVVAIVPPIDAKALGRGEARMVGWIELDNKSTAKPH